MWNVSCRSCLPRAPVSDEQTPAHDSETLSFMWVWQMAAKAVKETKTNREVLLGFLEEAESWQLLSNQFPSKVGGRPGWLSQVDLPTVSELQCEKCKLPTVFLLQVYAPVMEYDRCFHRTLFVFCCKTPACYTRNDNKCFKGNSWAVKICWVELSDGFAICIYYILIKEVFIWHHLSYCLKVV